MVYLLIDTYLEMLNQVFDEILICKIEFHIIIGFSRKYLISNPTLHEEGFLICIPLSLRTLQIQHEPEGSSSASQLAPESLFSERLCKYAISLQNFWSF